jgi:hypothetical protein
VNIRGPAQRLNGWRAICARGVLAYTGMSVRLLCAAMFLIAFAALSVRADSPEFVAHNRLAWKDGHSKSRRLPCVDWTTGAPYGYLRLFNKCDTCMQAWIHWSNGVNKVAYMAAHGIADTPILMSEGEARIFKESGC